MMEAARSSEEELSLSNCALVNQNDLQSGQHVVVKISDQSFVFTVKTHHTVAPGTIALNLSQREWVGLSVGQDVKVSNYTFDESTQSIGIITMEIDFLQRKKKTIDSFPYDSDKMAASFIQQFKFQAFSVHQQLVFCYCNKLFGLMVKEIEAIDANILKGEPISDYEQQKIDVGLLVGNSLVIFEIKEDSPLILVGKAKTIDWNFEKLGMGLSEEFCESFRKIFISRVIPPVVVEVLGLKHVKSILLSGCPGCGKTRLARLIGTMLNARKLESVEVGDPEVDIQSLITEAVEEQEILGSNSGVHIIIFDDMDGFCTRTGGAEDNSSGAVCDSLVNQLLCEMDGMDQLNNILVIGTTNRIDLVDDTLMKHGRFEVHVKIGLPDEKGREQILKIHTDKMRRSNFLSSDVDVKELAAITQNFSGAELEGLIRAAQSYALTRILQTSAVLEAEPDELLITRADFMTSLSNKDVAAAFGRNPDDFFSFITSDIINWESDVAPVSSENPEDSSSPVVKCEIENPPVSGGKPAEPSGSIMSIAIKCESDQ